MANRKFLERVVFIFNCCAVAVISVVVFDVYKALRPKHPDIDSPQALVEQSRELIGEAPSGHFDYVEVPREQWPTAIAALRPRFVYLFSQSGEARGSVVDYVEIIISTGGIGGSYGYLVCFPRKGDAGSFLIHKNSAIIFENESGSIVRYIADH